MAFGSDSAPFFWFWLRRAWLRRRRVAWWRKIILAFELMDHEWLLAAAALRSSLAVKAATIERHSWTRARMASFFPDIVRNWSNRKFKRNFRVSRDTFECSCSELQSVLGKRYAARTPILVQQCVAMTLWRLWEWHSENCGRVSEQMAIPTMCRSCRWHRHTHSCTCRKPYRLL